MNFYFLNTGSPSWNTGTNWSNTDGGVPAMAIPSITDDVFLTAISGDLVQDAGVRLDIKTLTCTGYTRTLTLNPNGALAVNGNIVLSATMKMAGSANFSIVVSGSILTNGCIIPQFRAQGAPITVTLLDTLNISGTMSTTGSDAITWAGSFGFNVTGNYNDNSTQAVPQTLQSGITYTIRGKFSHTLERGNNHGKWQSSTPGTRARLTVTGDTNIGYVDFTDIDASGGRTLYPFTGIVTNCLNVISLTDRLLPPNLTVATSRVT